MFGLGATELLLILAVVLLLFGGSRIPQLFRGLGEGIRNFKQGLNGNETSGDSTPLLPPDGTGSDRHRS